MSQDQLQGWPGQRQDTVMCFCKGVRLNNLTLFPLSASPVVAAFKCVAYAAVFEVHGSSF